MIEFLDDIAQHFEADYPGEGCGILAVVKGKMKWFPCVNIATDKDDFVIDPKQYIKINRTSDIVAIVHSHPDALNTPSQSDIDHCDAVGIPYYIFSYPDMELHIQQPKHHVQPLLGREYKFGSLDCFESARDYYREKLKIDLPLREAFEDDWWKKGLDYFSSDNLKKWNFKEVSDLLPGDLLIFSVEASVGNHCGVYLGNDMFFHHAVNRLSCRDSLMSRLWAGSIVGTYRYEA